VSYSASPARRLIVAADFVPIAPQGREYVRERVLSLADALHDTGVCLKVNSALRALGYDLFKEIRARGLRTFADLKLGDIPETLAADSLLLCEAKVDIVTAFCSVGTAALHTLLADLPEAEVFGVTVPTSLSDDDAHSVFGVPRSEAVMRLTKVAAKARMDGLVASAHEAEELRAEYGDAFKLMVPGIRPAWADVRYDDQNSACIATPTEAIHAGADYVVVGRPITQAENPRAAAERIIEEIYEAMKP
jgi:orotidine-5'-phosphate decarboxylase